MVPRAKKRKSNRAKKPTLKIGEFIRQVQLFDASVALEFKLPPPVFVDGGVTTYCEDQVQFLARLIVKGVQEGTFCKNGLEEIRAAGRSISSNEERNRLVRVFFEVLVGYGFDRRYFDASVDGETPEGISLLEALVRSLANVFLKENDLQIVDIVEDFGPITEPEIRSKLNVTHRIDIEHIPMRKTLQRLQSDRFIISLKGEQGYRSTLCRKWGVQI